MDASAGDRADALHDERSAREDRQRSREDRHRASEDRDAAAEAVHKAAAAAAEETADQREELEDRILIGIAQGLLIADHNVTADDALDLLVKRSQSSNVKLRDIAARLVEERANG